MSEPSENTNATDYHPSHQASSYGDSYRDGHFGQTAARRRPSVRRVTGRRRAAAIKAKSAEISLTYPHTPRSIFGLFAIERRFPGLPVLIGAAAVFLVAVGVAAVVIAGAAGSSQNSKAIALADALKTAAEDIKAKVVAADQSGAALALGAGAAADPDNAFAQYYFYDATRLERYQNYATQNPHLSTDEVVWMIDCDLDCPAYSLAVVTPEPSSLLALVNKTHCLPKDYYPDDLVEVGATSLRAVAAEPLGKLMTEASAAGITVLPTSGFRSYQTQVNTYNYHVGRVGQAEADNSSARPGFSEHQTGLVMDINSADYLVYESPEDYWLAEHAWEYGFLVRYTNANSAITQYVAEPWHLRYVGLDVAKFIHDKNIASFEEYYVKYVLYAPEP